MGANDPSEYSFSFQQNSKYDLNTKIMLTAIISLSAVILLVIFLHVYAKCLIRRARQRVAHRRHLATIRRTLVDHLEQPKSGLDPSVIVTLPVFVFRHDSDHNCNNETKSNLDCSICICMFEDGQMVRILPNCKHNFHAECVDMWLESQSTCPICRTEVEPIRLVVEPREGPVDRSVVRLELVTSGLLNNGEGTSNGGSAKVNGSSSRLSSLRRILSRDRSSWRSQDHVVEDLERQ